MIKRWLPVVLTLSLAACGGDTAILDEKIPEPAPLPDVSNAQRVNEIWNEDIGEGTNGLLLGFTPAITDRATYVASLEGVVVALDTKTGNTIWERDLDLGITAGPGLVGAALLLGSSEGKLIALSPRDGRKLWAYDLDSEMLTPPVFGAEAIAIVRTGDGKVHAIDVAKGERLWLFEQKVPTLSLRGNSTPVVKDSAVYVGFDNGKLLCLKITNGQPCWGIDVAKPKGRSDLERIVDVDGQLAIQGSVVYAASANGRIIGVTRRAGRIMWEEEFSSYIGLAANRDIVVAVDEADRLVGFDPRSGSIQWRNQELVSRKLTAPALYNGLAVLGDGEGYLHWLDLDTGRLVAQEKASDRLASPPQIFGNRVFTYAVDGEIAVWDIRKPTRNTGPRK